MKNLNFYLILNLINIFLLIIYLFISDFNYLKIAIFFLLILNISHLFLNAIFKKEKLISSQKEFYFELNNFFNLINTPFVIYDDQMKIIYFNEAFSKLVNLDKNLLTNLKIETWIIKNEQYLKLSLIFFPSLIADNIKIIQSGDLDIIEVSYQNTLFFTIISSKISYSQKIFNFKIITDYSKDYYQIRQSSEFLNLLAHHLRTPLNQLKWLLESIKNNSNQEEIDQGLAIVNKTILLTQMVILGSKTESNQITLNVELNNIEELIASCFDFFKYYLIEKNIKVEIFVEEQIKNFYFDKNLMFFIIYTLIENAIDYNKPNGKIVFNVVKHQQKNYVSISISDTGIGISEEDLKNIFKKYFRTKEAKEIKPTGFGLGLSLVANLAKIHKAEIRVESKKNIGTTFFLEFPLNKEIYGL